MMIMTNEKIAEAHLARKALIYIRQSSKHQVQRHQESAQVQYALTDRTKSLGWPHPIVIDEDLGKSAEYYSERSGFQALVTQVSMGGVGIVMSLEATRLARNNRDWYHLIDLCTIFDTLIGDHQSIYDPKDVNDRLLLGVKGTMSEAELNLIKLRMRQGRLSKARRGELYTSLPTGYILSDNGIIEKTPDIREQEVLFLIFKKFRELGSAKQTQVWFIQENITIPVNCKGKDIEGRKRRWQLPTHGFIVKFLHNPFYAGAYVYGRRYTSVAYKDGQLKKIYRERKESEEWEVFIRDHHEGYITWQEYEENLKMLRNNQCAEKPNETLGPARGGKALLSGIVRCQLCGRKMHTRYWGKKSTYSYYLCPGEYNQGGNRCQKFSAMSVDPVFEEELFRAIEPAAVQASIEACDIINKRYQEKITYLEKELESAKYEADRAFAQYNQVDPSNRLVASELERRWNEKLKVLNETQERIGQEKIKIQGPTKEDIEKIKSLSWRLPEIWRHPDTDPAIRKRIIRTLVEEVLVLPDTSDRSLLTMTIHWKGGIHTQVQFKRHIKGNNGNKTDESTVELLKKLAAYYPDEEIARVFNCHKLKTGRGNSWSRSKVRELRHRNKIPPFERDQDKNIHTLNEAAKRLGVKPHTVRILVKRGIIKAQQIIKYAPFKIESSELEKESVKTTIKELKDGIPFKSLGVVSKNQLSLFQ